ncbi:MAG: division/cell wall cluster transcriptional repressor MraZ [Acidimicrobiales bacterium]
MAGFFGRFEHSLDAKGRVILPAKFRQAFEHGGYFSQYHDGCLALWTPEEFEKQMVGMQNSAEAGGRDERNLARVWASGSAEVEIDKSGRMPIPQHLREFAALAGEALVLGAIDRVELWAPSRWEEKVQPSEAQLTDA